MLIIFYINVESGILSFSFKYNRYIEENGAGNKETKKSVQCHSTQVDTKETFKKSVSNWHKFFMLT